MRNISWQQTAMTILVIADGTVTKKNKKKGQPAYLAVG
jgi:hypothetical protein